MDAGDVPSGCAAPSGHLHHPEDAAERETMDYLEFIARVTSHIPDKGQVAVIDIAARPAIYYRHG